MNIFVTALVWLLLGVSACAGGRDFSGPPRHPVAFPIDYGNHAEAQTEWWYLQALLEDDDARTYSVFLSAFRHNPRKDRVAGLPAGEMAVEGNVTIFFGCLVDVETGEVLAEHWRPGWTRDLNKSSSAFEFGSGQWRLSGEGGRFTYTMPSKLGVIILTTKQTTEPMPIGALSRRAGAETTGRHRFPGAAFSYYAQPRVEVTGRVDAAGGERALRGSGWFEHQYGFIYSDLYRGWWWSALMLEDGTDLLLTRVTPLRDDMKPAYLGTIRRPGEAAKLVSDFSFTPMKTWQSPDTQATYPTRLRIQAPSEGLDLDVRARLEDVEWDVEPAPIWEGPVVAVGTHRGEAVRGTGFCEFLEKGDRWIRRLYSSGLQTAVDAAMRHADHPDDPFADHYVPPEAKELGTAAGQIRLLASSGLTFDGDGVLSSLSLSTEFMTYSFLGIRASTTGSLFDLTDGGPSYWAWQLGPSLHLRPYKRVDLGAYFEAGPAIVREPKVELMPALSGGVFFDVSLTTYWFLQLEAKITWGGFEPGARSRSYVAPAGFLGLGAQI